MGGCVGRQRARDDAVAPVKPEMKEFGAAAAEAASDEERETRAVAERGGSESDSGSGDGSQERRREGSSDDGGGQGADGPAGGSAAGDASVDGRSGDAAVADEAGPPAGDEAGAQADGELKGTGSAEGAASLAVYDQRLPRGSDARSANTLSGTFESEGPIVSIMDRTGTLSPPPDPSQLYERRATAPKRDSEPKGVDEILRAAAPAQKKLVPVAPISSQQLWREKKRKKKMRAVVEEIEEEEEEDADKAEGAAVAAPSPLDRLPPLDPEFARKAF